MAKYLSVKFTLRHAVSEILRIANPVLGAGELCVEIDTLRIKMGDGQTPWNNLRYIPIYKNENGVPAEIWSRVAALRERVKYLEDVVGGLDLSQKTETPIIVDNGDGTYWVFGEYGTEVINVWVNGEKFDTIELKPQENYYTLEENEYGWTIRLGNYSTEDNDAGITINAGQLKEQKENNDEI